LQHHPFTIGLFCDILYLSFPSNSKERDKMFKVTTHVIEGEDSFESDARAAIIAAFERDGEAPNAVLVRPGTTDLASVAVGLGSPAEMNQIPVVVREDSKMVPSGQFALDISHGILE
jgi:hypothetical protein